METSADSMCKANSFKQTKKPPRSTPFTEEGNGCLEAHQFVGLPLVYLSLL